MDEDEEKLEEIKRAFTSKVETIKTIPDMVTFIKNMTPAKVKNFIKIQLQKDIGNEGDSITHIEGNITFKQNLINEIDNM